MEKDFVSQETKKRIAEIKAEFEKTKAELEELEKPYMDTAASQLKMINVNYQSRKKTIIAKLQYLQAAYDEAELKASLEQERGNKRWMDALDDFYYNLP